jgi:P27 family predicted phage terminase small subunit
MGLRGPAPTPTKILEARGSRRAKTRNGEPMPRVEAPSCPAWLGKEAKAEWRRASRELRRLGILAKLDRATLAIYAEAWGEFVALTAEVQRLDYEQAIAKGILSAKNKAAERVLRYGREFGMSPSARTRLCIEPPQAEDPDAARFFKYFPGKDA